MEDLVYILSLGFSGSDFWRAIIIAFFAAMLVGKSRPVAIMGIWALFVDRLAWPLTTMWMAGADSAIMTDTVSGMMQSLNLDLGLYLVRYAGLMVMIAAFAHLRRRIHKPRTDKAKGKLKPAHA
ncbi:MAG: hypothetical protein AAFR20_09710 [Pseudomonadota bacterium]